MKLSKDETMLVWKYGCRLFSLKTITVKMAICIKVILNTTTNQLLGTYRGVYPFFVCADNWTSQFSDSVCRQLGYTLVLIFRKLLLLFSVRDLAYAVCVSLQLLWLTDNLIITNMIQTPGRIFCRSLVGHGLPNTSYTSYISVVKIELSSEIVCWFLYRGFVMFVLISVPVVIVHFQYW